MRLNIRHLSCYCNNCMLQCGYWIQNPDEIISRYYEYNDIPIEELYDAERWMGYFLMHQRSLMQYERTRKIWKQAENEDNYIDSFVYYWKYKSIYFDARDFCKELLVSLKAIRDYKRAKARSNKKRLEIRKNYSKLFEKLVERDGYYCKLCNTTENLEIDHIRPVALNGNNDLSNLQLLCKPCNISKSANWEASNV